jgi:hypothetical protein
MVGKLRSGDRSFKSLCEAVGRLECLDAISSLFRGKLQFGEAVEVCSKRCRRFGGSSSPAVRG